MQRKLLEFQGREVTSIKDLKGAAVRRGGAGWMGEGGAAGWTESHAFCLPAWKALAPPFLDLQT